jgi:hypothetical protein
MCHDLLGHIFHQGLKPSILKFARIKINKKITGIKTKKLYICSLLNICIEDGDK